MFSVLPPHLTAFFSGIYSGNNFGGTPTDQQPFSPTLSPRGTSGHPPTLSTELKAPTNSLTLVKQTWDDASPQETSQVEEEATEEFPRSPPTVMDFDFIEPAGMDSNSSFGLLGDELDEDFFVEDFRQLMS